MVPNASIWISFFAGLALKSVVLLGAAFVVAVLLRSRSAAARHIVWTAAAAALIALPFLSLSLPSLPITVSHALVAPTIAVENVTAGLDDAHALQAHTTIAGNHRAARSSWRPAWPAMLIVLWTLGAGVSLVRMLLAWFAISRLRRAAVQLGIPDVSLLGGSFGAQGKIDVLEIQPGAMPMSFGLLRPAILLPADAAQWTEERRHMVLLHELAHVQRGDFATHVMARTALALYWWNPLAWIAWREFLKERERAADDLVLSAGAPPTEYAGHLLDIARAMQLAPAVESAAIPMVRRSQLENRLRAILDSRLNRETPRRLSAWMAVLAAIAIVIPLAAVRAQDSAQQKLPADVDAIIRSAASQRNFQILDDAAKAAATMQQYDVARKLLKSSLAVRGEVSGAESVDYGVGLLKLGDLDRLQGNTTNAQNLYTRAAAVLGNSPQAAQALIYLGMLSVKNKEFDKGLDYFEHAKLVNAARAGEATMWMAVAQQRENHNEQADQLYKQALALVGRSTADAATIMRVYAQFLEDQGRYEDALSMRQDAGALAKALGAEKMSAAKAAAGSNVFRIGGDVTAPKLVSKVEPEYTDEARAAKLTGTEIVYVEIDTDGIARNLVVTSGVGLGLDEKGIEAIRQWRFAPGTKDGQPVNVFATIEINFRLL